jgi:signal peptidase I
VTPEPTEPALVVDEPAGAGATALGEPVPPPVPPPSGSNSRWLREGVLVVLVAVLVAVLLRAFVVQTFYIPSGSMEPTLQVGDRILVNKLSYHLHDVHRGDIVVFGRPQAENCGGPEVNDLVKRVIGLPGDSISLHQGHVYIDGRSLDESWLPAAVQGHTEPGPPGNSANLQRAFLVPKGDYFVMGDNRTNSCDSRWWGPIPRSLIVGKVEMRVWPVPDIRLF